MLAKLSWVEAKLFLREPLALVFTFAFPFFMLIVLAGVFGNDLDPTSPDYAEQIRVWRGVGPTDYYAPAYVALVIASVGLIALPLRMAGYRERGVLRRFHAAGLSLPALIGSQVVVAAGLVIVGSVGIAITARLFYGAMLPEQWPQSLAAYAAALVCFCAVGVALGAVLPTARAAQGAGLILFFVMMMIGGAGPPRGVLSAPMRWMSNPLPFTHAVLALQDPWLGQGWDWTAFSIVVAFTAAATVVAVRWFRWG
jgi:ABC-2 type transport system permease protein